ncbi:MAG: GNAT family N-acetyltransferase [Nitrospirota bacterium]
MTNDLKIIEVRSKKDLYDFIKFPFTLYSQDSCYVPPLIKEVRDQFSHKNPFFLHADVRFFLAKKNGKTAGRIVSIINHRHIEFHNEKAGFFGFFESLNDYEISSVLLNRASEVLKKQGMEIMRGPMNFSTNEECGFLIEGFNEPPMLMTPYNPPYYNDLMEKYGMIKAKDLYAYIVDIPEELPEKIYKAAEIAIKNATSVRPVNKKRFDHEMNIFKEVYNSAWEKNWGFIPLTDEELTHLGKRLKTIIVPELTLIAEKDNKPVGFFGAVPDFNFVLQKMRGRLNPITIAKAFYYSKKIKDMRLLLLGIKAEYRRRGVDAVLFKEGFKEAKKRGYKRAELSWILEDNLPVQMLVKMIGGNLYKKYRIYEKRL